MKITDILKVVSDVTNIPENEITSKSKREDVVRAKRLFVDCSKKFGYSTTTIADVMHITTQAVRNLYATQDLRKLYNVYSKEIEKIIANTK